MRERVCAYRAGRPWGGTRREWRSETGRSDNGPRRPVEEWRRGEEIRERNENHEKDCGHPNPAADPGPLCTLSTGLSGRFVRPPRSMATLLTDTLYILRVWWEDSTATNSKFCLFFFLVRRPIKFPQSFLCELRKDTEPFMDTFNTNTDSKVQEMKMY